MLSDPNASSVAAPRITSEPVLDPETLANLAELGGVEFVEAIVDVFVRDVPKTMATAREALANLDLEAVRRAAHSVLGSAGQLGAPGVASLAHTIETFAMRKDLESTRAPMAELDALVPRVVAELLAWKQRILAEAVGA